MQITLNQLSDVTVLLNAGSLKDSHKFAYHLYFSIAAHAAHRYIAIR